MAWEPLQTADGSWTLVHPGHGQACHSRDGAWQEARERYALACRLPERALARSPLRVLDVGTGLGWNIAAALQAAGGVRLEVLSLESDREVVHSALELAPRQAGGTWSRWYEPVLAALRAALDGPSEAGGTVELVGPQGQPLGELTLRFGDARATLPAAGAKERFDAVFLDPFSPGVESELWGEPFLEHVATRLEPDGWLSTYSSAFRVRLGLARAGLRVGAGPRVGAKSSGTLASPSAQPPPLDARTERRLRARCGNR